MRGLWRRSVVASIGAVVLVASGIVVSDAAVGARLLSHVVATTGTMSSTTGGVTTAPPGTPRAVRIVPSGPLHGGQTVTLLGEGFHANASVVSVAECQFQSGGTGDCAPETLMLTSSDARGRVRVQYRMRRRFVTYLGRAADCAQLPCSLSVQDLIAVPLFSDGVTVSLSFAS